MVKRGKTSLSLTDCRERDATFRQLLSQLADAHEKELDELRRALDKAQACRPSENAFGLNDALVSQEGPHLIPSGSVVDKPKSRDVDDSPNFPLAPRLKKGQTERLSTSSLRGILADDKSHGAQHSQRPFKCFVHPDSAFRNVFDILSIVISFFDVIYIPLWVLFLDEQMVNKYFTLVTATIFSVFWTADIALTFCTGIHDENGHITSDFSYISASYLRGVFAVDVVTVACDWMTVALLLVEFQVGADYPVVGAVRLHRFFRVVRIFGILRCIKRVNVLWRFVVSFDTQFLFGQILKYFFIILIANHFIACAWYRIGTYKHSSDDPWLAYFTSLHWAICQMTPGSMEVHPRTTNERIFNVIVLIFGLLVGSSLVSLLSSKMVQFQMAGHEHTKQELLLRKYMTENRVSTPVYYKALKHFNSRKEDTALLESKVLALKQLPEVVLAEIQSEAFFRHLYYHPFFFALHSRTKRTFVGSTRGSAFKDLYVKAFNSLCLAEGETLFHSSTVGNEAYVVAKGSVCYSGTSGGSDTCLSGGTPALDDPLPLLSEPSLLTNDWVRQGSARSLSNCKVLTISRQHLQQALSTEPGAMLLYVQHAAAFAKWRMHVQCTDVLTDFDRWFIVLELDEDSRLDMASEALRYVRGKTSWISKNFGFGLTLINDLENEVIDKKVSLSVGVDGCLERTVMIALVELARPDNRVLVQFSQTSDDRAIFQLPGTKVKFGETPLEAIRRACRWFFGDTDDSLLNCDVERKVDMISSSALVRTRYLKSLYRVSAETTDEIGVSLTQTMFGKPDRQLRDLQSALKQIGDENIFLESGPVYIFDPESGSKRLFCWLELKHYHSLHTLCSTTEAMGTINA